jgi:hypothetical protein
MSEQTMAGYFVSLLTGPGCRDAVIVQIDPIERNEISDDVGGNRQSRG